MEAILIAFEVRKYFKSKVSKELHLANKFFIFVTSEISTLSKDKKVIEEHP